MKLIEDKIVETKIFNKNIKRGDIIKIDWPQHSYKYVEGIIKLISFDRDEIVYFDFRTLEESKLNISQFFDKDGNLYIPEIEIIKIENV